MASLKYHVLANVAKLEYSVWKFRIALMRIRLASLRARQQYEMSHFRDVVFFVTCVCVIVAAFIFAFAYTLKTIQ